jgi:hypothetical protein
LLSFVLSIPVFAQQTTSSSPQALALLHRSLATLTGGQSITDVTLSGTARRIAGSDDESGTVTFEALSSGAARFAFSYPSGPRMEVRGPFSSEPLGGAWYGPDGVSHAVAYHNLLAEPTWSFPAFAIARRLSTSHHAATYVGHETHDGQEVEHISVWQAAPLSNPPGTATFEHLTKTDFFLDSSTLLPVAITFNIHPDEDAGLDLPVEVRFSDYHSVNGSQIPFNVQKLLNNSLILDLQFTNAFLNSGLSASLFNVQ